MLRGVTEIKQKGWCIAILSSVIFVMLATITPPWPLLAKLLVIDHTPEKVDVLITLGGGAERERYAAELYRLGFARGIIMSGCGNAARQMAKEAIRLGVKEQDIIIEEKARNTYENALYSRDIMSAQNLKSAIVVTSPYHMRRTKLVFGRVFKNTGMKLLYCSTKDSGFNADGQCRSGKDRQVVRREYIKLIYYWMRYW